MKNINMAFLAAAIAFVFIAPARPAHAACPFTAPDGTFRQTVEWMIDNVDAAGAPASVACTPGSNGDCGLFGVKHWVSEVFELECRGELESGALNNSTLKITFAPGLSSVTLPSASYALDIPLGLNKLIIDGAVSGAEKFAFNAGSSFASTLLYLKCSECGPDDDSPDIELRNLAFHGGARGLYISERNGYKVGIILDSLDLEGNSLSGIEIANVGEQSIAAISNITIEGAQGNGIKIFNSKFAGVNLADIQITGQEGSFIERGVFVLGGRPKVYTIVRPVMNRVNTGLLLTLPSEPIENISIVGAQINFLQRGVALMAYGQGVVIEDSSIIGDHYSWADGCFEDYSAVGIFGSALSALTGVEIINSDIGWTLGNGILIEQNVSGVTVKDSTIHDTCLNGIMAVGDLAMPDPQGIFFDNVSFTGIRGDAVKYTAPIPPNAYADGMINVEATSRGIDAPRASGIDVYRRRVDPATGGPDLQWLQIDVTRYFEWFDRAELFWVDGSTLRPIKIESFSSECAAGSCDYHITTHINGTNLPSYGGGDITDGLIRVAMAKTAGPNSGMSMLSDDVRLSMAHWTDEEVFTVDRCGDDRPGVGLPPEHTACLENVLGDCSLRGALFKAADRRIDGTFTHPIRIIFSNACTILELADTLGIYADDVTLDGSGHTSLTLKPDAGFISGHSLVEVNHPLVYHSAMQYITLDGENRAGVLFDAGYATTNLIKMAFKNIGDGHAGVRAPLTAAAGIIPRRVVNILDSEFWNIGRTGVGVEALITAAGGPFPMRLANVKGINIYGELPEHFISGMIFVPRLIEAARPDFSNMTIDLYGNSVDRRCSSVEAYISYNTSEGIGSPSLEHLHGPPISYPLPPPSQAFVLEGVRFPDDYNLNRMLSWDSLSVSVLCSRSRPGYPEYSYDLTPLMLVLEDLSEYDSDEDDIHEFIDNCPAVANPDQADLDNDEIGDACDSDRDGDGTDNTLDNCPDIANFDQADVDSDSLGDVCDDDIDGDEVLDDDDECPFGADLVVVGGGCARDDDRDGVPDDIDSCPGVPNTGLDLDGDRIDNACDPDNDNDGALNAADNCPAASNPDQADIDSDSLGDVCDNDNDNDGVLDAVDNCRLISNSAQTDTDGDGTGDVCDDDIVVIASCPAPGILQPDGTCLNRSTTPNAPTRGGGCSLIY